ncbi:MAG: hypothetical protein M3O25_10090 [Actinomycetota bacterium]|nr:hypothetical protein [Actinomycetota bacterium]
MDSGTVLIVIALVALPIAAIAFATGAGKALSQIGKGELSIEQQMPRADVSAGPSAAVREQEIRQMVEARSYRREARGDEPLDVEAEVGKLLRAAPSAPGLGADRGLREEVRQLVVARNERRQRRGESELDVEAEVDRQLRELEGLGQ